tara:strand:- start:62 stop:1024 length:963 start_codon:yes stop_codon:yes gene_type:complete
MTKANTIIVTGGLGFIGSRFIQALYKRTDYSIINIDKCTYAAEFTRIPLDIRHDVDRYRFIKEDISKLGFDKTNTVDNAILKDVKYVVNFAAESHVDNSISDGRPFVRSNVESVMNLLDTFKDAPNMKKFIQVSTDEVYGDMADLEGDQKASESFALRPSSYYSASKASAEMLVQAAARTFGVDYIITRSCNNFGPNQDAEKFLPTVLNCIQKGLRIPIYGTGTQSREWIHVDDNCNIILDLMLSPVANEVFNIGSGNSYKNIEIIEMLGKELKKKVNTKHVADRLGHDKVYKIDCTKTEKLLGSRDYATLKSFLKNETN